jgi:tetratricopeptide (TPR) repeat protein
VNRNQALALLFLALAGCGGIAKQDAEPPTERQTLNRSAQLAFSRGQYAQAATLYQATLDKALIEDTPGAIVDARFNLALSQTYLGNHRAALDQVTQADAERVRRELGPDPELELLRATLHYRAGDPAAAQRTLDSLLDDSAVAPPTAARAHFVAGLIAAHRNDVPALRKHRDALPADDGPGARADRLELDGRPAAFGGEPDQALRLLDEAMLLRSADRDYRGMARVLVVAGDVAERTGRTGAAADYLLRAGRSAARRGDPDARAWLERARGLGERGGDAALVLEADTMLIELGSARPSP